MKIAVLIFVLLFWTAQTILTDGSPRIYADLGFRYTPPEGLCDSTDADRLAVQERAAALHTAKVLDVRLSIQSTTGDTGPEWKKIGIETYPRRNLAGLSDRDTSLKVARWVAHNGTETGGSKNVAVAGLTFTGLSFELREQNLVRHADVFTTIRNGQVISFSFSANSEEVLRQIEASIETIEILPLK